jgi:hypothetical protein
MPGKIHTRAAPPAVWSTVTWPTTAPKIGRVANKTWPAGRPACLILFLCVRSRIRPPEEASPVGTARNRCRQEREVLGAP